MSRRDPILINGVWHYLMIWNPTWLSMDGLQPIMRSVRKFNALFQKGRVERGGPVKMQKSGRLWKGRIVAGEKLSKAVYYKRKWNCKLETEHLLKRVSDLVAKVNSWV